MLNLQGSFENLRCSTAQYLKSYTQQYDMEVLPKNSTIRIPEEIYKNLFSGGNRS